MYKNLDNIGKNVSTSENISNEGYISKNINELLYDKPIRFSGTITERVSINQLMRDPSALSGYWDTDYMRDKGLLKLGVDINHVSELSKNVHVVVERLVVNSTHNELPFDLLIKSPIIMDPTSIEEKNSNGENVSDLGILAPSGKDYTKRTYNSCFRDGWKDKAFKDNFDHLRLYTNKSIESGSVIISGKGKQVDSFDMISFDKDSHVLKCLRQYGSEFKMKPDSMKALDNPVEGQVKVDKLWFEKFNRGMLIRKEELPIGERAIWQVTRLGEEWKSINNVNSLMMATEKELEEFYATPFNFSVSYDIDLQFIHPHS